MSAIIPANRSTMLKAQWQDAMTQASKGLSRLQKGIRRFVTRRPLVTAVMTGLGAIVVVRAFGSRR